MKGRQIHRGTVLPRQHRYAHKQRAKMATGKVTQLEGFDLLGPIPTPIPTHLDQNYIPLTNYFLFSTLKVKRDLFFI